MLLAFTKNHECLKRFPSQRTEFDKLLKYESKLFLANFHGESHVIYIVRGTEWIKYEARSLSKLDQLEN